MNKCFTTRGVYITNRVEPSYCDYPQFPFNKRTKKKRIMSPYLTKEEAIELAKQYGVEQEVEYLMEHGFTPEEALREWDCPPEEERP